MYYTKEILRTFCIDSDINTTYTAIPAAYVNANAISEKFLKQKHINY